jgi:peptidoglycan/xylan/chitin deacetylase (PgdA/CDA1 family)
MPESAQLLQTARRAARRLRARLRQPAPGLILAYHRVASSPLDPHRLCVSEDHFRGHMLALHDRWHPVRLTDIPKLVSSPRFKSPPFVAVTFDDGYVDNLETALPILEEAGVPATVFITVNNMDTGTPYWWDYLAAVLIRVELSVRAIDLRVSGSAWTHDLTTFAAREQAHAGLQQMLTGLPAAEIDEVLAQLTGQCGLDVPGVGITGVPMTREEVRKLSASPLIDIGSHGLSHANLTAIPRSDVDAETFVAKKTLERVAGQPVLSFSYPFGFCDEAAGDAVVTAGYAVACTLGGAVRSTSDRHRYGRLLVRDWPASVLEASMHRYLST